MPATRFRQQEGKWTNSCFLLQPVQKIVADEIAKAIKKGDTVAEITKKLFDGYGYGHLLPVQDIPDFMKKLTSIGRENEYKGMKFRKTLRQVERQLKRVNAQGLKIAYKEIKGAVEEGNEKRIQKAIYVATQERTRYFARRIARTEMARAYGDGVMAEWADDDDCVAFKWHTSSGHPFCDICDLYGNANLYGMGKGIYPKDKVPRLPVHPNCMCHLRPIMDGSNLLQGKEKDQVEQGGMDYIQGLKKHDQETLLGVGGRKEVLRKGDWRTYARGYSGEVMKKRGIISGGAIYGALNDKNDPMGKRREVHAKLYYDFIRSVGEESFVSKISENTGFSRSFVSAVFNHVFIDKHHLYNGYRRFDPSYYMAVSFQRLLAGNYNDNDIVLLRHEHLERAVEKRYNLRYTEAHKLAEKKYFYKRKG